MKILIAPDKFRESLSSIEAAKSIEKGIKKVNKNIETVLCPIADGGEGTVDALVAATSVDTLFVMLQDHWEKR